MAPKIWGGGGVTILRPIRIYLYTICMLNVKKKKNRAIMPLIAHLSPYPNEINSTFFVPIVPSCDPQGWASVDPRGIIWKKT